MPGFLTLFFVAVFALASAAPAGAADLGGTWQLDRSASDSPDELLQAQGVGWLKRKAAAGMSVTLIITHLGDDKVKIETVSSARTKTDTLEIDGEVRDVEGERGTAKVRHEWKGEVLVTTAVMSMKNGEGTVVSSRSVSDDGKTLTQRVELTRPDGTQAKFTRVFRRS